MAPVRNSKRLVLGHLGRNALVSSLGGERTFISFAVRYTLTQADSSWSGIICLVRNTISRAALASAVLCPRTLQYPYPYQAKQNGGLSSFVTVSR